MRGEESRESDALRRKVVLVFMRHYLPGYKAGGPIRSIANLVEALGDEFDFRIVTSDRDATDVEPYADISCGEWIRVGKAQVLYLNSMQRSFLQILKILRETPHDILYLNSFFDFTFTQIPLLAYRFGMVGKLNCILAPRGEFSEGALKIKATKKALFLFGVRIAGLYHNLRWHASSHHEEADIRSALGEMTARDVRIAINVPDAVVRELPPFEARNPNEALRVCFLSRISPKKNLSFALEVLRQVRVQVRFDIYGLVDDEQYWGRCQALIRTLPENIKVNYQGVIPHAEVAGVLARYDLFFLPTLGENYGHAIFEALSAGTPLLIADTTPWRDLGQLGVGWDVSLSDTKQFVERIELIARMDAKTYGELRRSSENLAKSCRESDAAIVGNRNLFLV